MSLTKCVECGGAVSTKASVCPHCGCPIDVEPSYMCKIHGKNYDLSEVMVLVLNGNTPENRLKGCRLIQSITGIEIWNAKGLWDEMVSTKQAPSVFLCLEEKRAQNQPKCPTCGSTNIERINLSTRAAATVLFGVVSKTGRSQFRCRACGYKW